MPPALPIHIILALHDDSHNYRPKNVVGVIHVLYYSDNQQTNIEGALIL